MDVCSALEGIDAAHEIDASDRLPGSLTIEFYAGWYRITHHGWLSWFPREQVAEALAIFRREKNNET